MGGHGLFQIEPEEAPIVAGGVEGLDHGNSIISVCFLEKRSI